jgi:hypothetical protein
MTLLERLKPGELDTIIKRLENQPNTLNCAMHALKTKESWLELTVLELFALKKPDMDMDVVYYIVEIFEDIINIKNEQEVDNTSNN